MVSGEQAAFGWAECGRVPAGGEITVIVGAPPRTLAGCRDGGDLTGQHRPEAIE
jgi:hypothetical protein